MSKQEWILSVFDDIRQYAALNGLREITAMLPEARQAAALEMDIEKLPKVSRKD